MREFFGAEGSELYLLLALLLGLLLIWGVVYWVRKRKKRTLATVLDTIAFERLEGLVIPNTDDGEIQVDHIVLTAQGLLIIDTKDVVGTVFGSDKMQEWAVISQDHRFTFSNPQPALYDRIAAVRQIVRQVPVNGRVVFLDGAEFTKGTPSLTCDLDGLLADFSEPEKAAAISKVEAFRPHWEALKQANTLQ